MTASREKNADEVSTRAGSLLRELGFGANETAVILSLNGQETATVADIFTETGIHHANLYSILDSLVGRGLVVLHQGRPKMYQMAPLSHIKEMFLSKYEQLLEDLKFLRETKAAKDMMPALIYTIRGKADVLTKILSMVDRAHESIFLVTPDFDSLGMMMNEHLRKAQFRGVKLRAIFGKKPSSHEFKIQHRIKRDALAVNLVVDSTEALISMPDLAVCGWADNALISMQLEGFLQQSWESSKKE
jgi:sugar-specific transcriptional regulator TrmB